ncbi:Oligopeptide transport ATP-binding protein OppD (TC 3.A.1.5.1) [hydrothermal vent metagenome]|uniref:Oligopeptide transport ATP-binding protein OppD (TC 3.A.1.5.1) n=1 Tax=hydrothermal vent metagenome TaxID=652676 RepID=A0A3B0UAN4_9ZZZZ
MSTNPLIQVDALSLSIGDVDILCDVSFQVAAGQTLAIVGESGCGKSITALAMMGLLPEGAQITSGSIALDGRELVGLAEQEMQDIRGNKISMIFQEPVLALDPLMNVGDQIIEALTAHGLTSARDATKEALALLERVGIPEARQRLQQYPFELSGGMCQRIMIATALACRPGVLIADEPTTALDVTIQAQILRLIAALGRELQTAIILITHDLGVVADMADHVAVMYGGSVVETGGVHDIFASPGHPYTQALLRSIPRLDGVPKAELEVISGMVPDARHWPAGCRFHPRCAKAMERCKLEKPLLLAQKKPDHFVACWWAEKGANA